ncbi:TonB-dependent receptor plug domain-containing protein [Mangrovibacterium lignilyticum]|uniref:TonB-dependent receptor plug domain-containing protein n=1 Tax=Mangrovibacterium lignilyticum TaxID=2668052 RepID=UPI0013D186A8|nr:TonB-dependent receptor plug domain-containing protein [Mangrovibacterium lignilyticum]
MKAKRSRKSPARNPFIKIAFVIVILSSGTQLYAQEDATIDGRVTEEEFGEPLEKAIVQIKGTSAYTVTNRFGYFQMKLPPAFFQVEAIHPGIFSEYYNVSTFEGILTPMGAVRLEPFAVGRSQQHGLAARVNPAQHPAATRNTPVLDMLNQSGSTDFNELFTGQPSVYLLENGGGYGSSEIRVRGFAANQNQVVFNGISMNNPETGRMNTPLYPGFNDWAQQVQFTTGPASGKQSELGQTGLINVLPFMPNKKFGVSVSASMGFNGYLKTAATMHSGISDRKLAFTLKLDRTSGDGIPDFTGFESYGMYFNLYKEYSHMHSFLFTNVLKTWQADLRNRPDSVSRISNFGIDHNSDWGFLNNKELGWNESFGIANLSVLTHHWHLRVHSKLVSQLYAELENSAYTFPQGTMNGQNPYEIPATDRGLVDFDAISAYNSGQTNSETAGISTLAAATRSTRIGLQSQFIHEFDKERTLFLSADLEQYTADHFGAVNNLLGASDFLSSANMNGTGSTAVNLLEMSFLPTTGQADKVNHDYRSFIRKAGFSMKVQKRGNQTFMYAETGLYIKSLKREDYFSYLDADSHQKTDWVSQFGWRVSSGLTYRLNEFHSLRLNTGASGSPTRFDVLFPAENNWESPSAINQNLYSGEIAYVLNSSRFFVSLRAYAMYQQNRTDIQRMMLNEGEGFAVLSGLNQFHRGVELNGQMTYFKHYNLYVSASYGKWTFNNSANAAIYDEDNQLLSEADLAFKGYKTDNCPPVSIYAKNEFNLLKGLELNINYYRSFATYAPLLVHDFDNTDSPEQIKLPAFDKLGVGLNYYHELRKNRSINVFADVQNILGSEYINQLYTNESGSDQFRSNLAMYGKGMSWRAGLTFSF